MSISKSQIKCTVSQIDVCNLISPHVQSSYTSSVSPSPLRLTSTALSVPSYRHRPTIAPHRPPNRARSLHRRRHTRTAPTNLHMAANAPTSFATRSDNGSTDEDALWAPVRRNNMSIATTAAAPTTTETAQTRATTASAAPTPTSVPTRETTQTTTLATALPVSTATRGATATATAPTAAPARSTVTTDDVICIESDTNEEDAVEGADVGKGSKGRGRTSRWTASRRGRQKTMPPMVLMRMIGRSAAERLSDWGQDECDKDCQCHRARAALLARFSTHLKLHKCDISQLQTRNDEVRASDEVMAYRSADLVVVESPIDVEGEGNRVMHSEDLLRVQTCSALLGNLSAKGGHVVVVGGEECTRYWHRALRASRERVGTSSGSGSRGGERMVKKRSIPLFDVDRDLMLFVKGRAGMETSGAGAAFPELRSVGVTRGVHAVRVGLAKREARAAAARTYINYGESGSVLSARCGVLTDLDELHFMDAVWADIAFDMEGGDSAESHDAGSGKRQSVAYRGMAISTWKELIRRFSSDGSLVVDPMAGVCSTGAAVARMEGGALRRYIACEDNPDLYEIARVRMAYELACMVRREEDRRPELPFIVDAGVLEDARVVVDHTFRVKEVCAAVRRVRMGLCRARPGYKWTLSASGSERGLPTMQRQPSHVLTLLREYCTGSSSSSGVGLDEVSGFSPASWGPEEKGMLLGMDGRVLQMAEERAFGLRVGKSTVKHAGAGFGVFSTRAVGVGETVCLYYGYLLYEAPEDRVDDGDVLNTGCGMVSAGRFRRFAMRVMTGEGSGVRRAVYGMKVDDGMIDGLEGKGKALQYGGEDVGVVKERGRNWSLKGKGVFVVPTEWCVAGMINDPRYVEGDQELRKYKMVMKRFAGAEHAEKRKSLSIRSANVRAEQVQGCGGVNTVEELEDVTLIRYVAKSAIAVGEELFVDYGSEYEWGDD